jgi:ribosomal protein L21
VLGAAGAHAQTNARNIALKNGESAELQQVYWVTNCRSVMVGTPVIEILEGPEEVTLALKEGMVLPRRQNCANKVPGGTVVVTAKDVTEPKQGKLTYRVKYKTKDGERQSGHIFNVSLFP